MDECEFDFEKLAFGKSQNFGLCSSQVFDPSILPYVCPFQTKICSSTPCSKLGIEGDATDPTNEKGCTFKNAKVKKACKLADKQEKFDVPCGNDFYTTGISVTYSDATPLGDNELTWGDIKKQAMAPGYEDSSYWVSTIRN